MKELYIFLLIILAFTGMSQSPINTPDNIGSGNCLDFDGANDRVICGNIGDLGNAYTAEAWINLDNVNSGNLVTYVRDGGSTTASQAIALLMNNGQLVFRVRDDASNETVLRSNTLVTGQWYHIAGVRNGNSTELYVNGELVDNDTQTFGVISENACAFGTIWHDGSNSWETHADGQIDEVRIWTTARSETEIRDNMTGSLTGSETGLLGYWDMNEGTGNNVADLTGNGNDGTRQ